MLEIVEKSYQELAALSDEEASRQDPGGGWSRKQLIGHLIDSACNNHQRFVRAQWSEKLEFPPYRQDEWVECQRYNLRDWHELLDLWRALNRHLAHVLEVMDQRNRETPCVIGWRPGPDNVISLGAVIDHYRENLEHHLNQILP